MRTLRRYEEPGADSVVTSRPVYVGAGYLSIANAVPAIVGAALTVVGLIVLVRTGIDRSWFRPVVEVLDANHTALLGALELGAGALLIVAAAARSRGLAALVGLAMAVGGVFAAIQASDVARQLAIEDWWAWTMVGAGALVALTALLPPGRAVAA